MSQHAELRQDRRVDRRALASGVIPGASRHLRTWGLRLGWSAAAFAVAFVLDLATERRSSMVLGGTATAFTAAILLRDALRRVLPLLLYLGTWVLFNVGRAFGEDMPLALGGRDLVARAERTLFGGRLPVADVQATMYQPGGPHLHDAALTAVHLSFFVTPFLAALILFARARPLLRRYVLASALCLTTGMAAFALLPTAPPWLLGGDAGVVRVADQVFASLGVAITDAGGVTSGGYVFEPNHLASMPSIHIAAVALISCAAWAHHRAGAVALLSVLYWALMAVAVVYLGEHYLLDVVAGTAVALASWRVAGWLLSTAGDRPQKALTPALARRPSPANGRGGWG